MQYPFYIRRQICFFCPLSLQHCTSKTGHSTWHKTSGTLVECHAACQDPSPWGPQWLAAIITLKVHAVISGGLDWSGCLLEIVHLLICTAIAQAAGSGGAWKSRGARGSPIYCLLHSPACFFTLHRHQICVDDSSTWSTSPLSPMCMFTWWHVIVAATRVCSQNSLCRMPSAEVGIFNVYYIIINRLQS